MYFSHLQFLTAFSFTTYGTHILYNTDTAMAVADAPALWLERARFDSPSLSRESVSLVASSPCLIAVLLP